mmetsp:Transcript_7852/g.7338  ORF Transcript_7852/g.7338 Transcript_7852/m.7338 type:complete len:123 (-) Transcript_7852:1331-1699(-)
MSILEALYSGEPYNITNAGAIKYGQYDPNPYSIQDLPFFILIGIFGGLLGAYFVSVNNFMGKMRKQYIGTNKIKKVIETLIYTAVTCTVTYFAPSWINDCLNEQNSNFPSPDHYVAYTCPDG